MPNRVTLQDVATACGFHRTTVSMALRAHPAIAGETRRLVEAAAARLGYVPDPVLSALMAYRNGRRPPAFHSGIALLNCHPDRDALRRNPVYSRYLSGASARAMDRGYKLEEFWLPHWPEQKDRLAKTLRARNIPAAIVAPLPEPSELSGFPWEDFFAVALGSSLLAPVVPVVTNHQFRTMRRLVAELRMRGYRRIGLNHVLEWDEGVGRQWTGAFLAEQNTWREEERVPLLMVRQGQRADVLSWIRAHRPDCIITGDFELRARLEKEGLRVPQDIGVASEAVTERTPWLSGMDQNDYHIGAAAVDLVISLIHRAERGVPAIPRRVLLDSTWHEGETVRPRPENAMEPAVPPHA
jgi:LacI family transcriptional regulator